MRILLTTALLALGTLAAAAQTQRTPRADVPEVALMRPVATVAADVVTVGDLIENAGRHADRALFRAPDLGQFGTIQAWRVLEALRGIGITRLETHGVAEVRVERHGRSIASSEMADAVAGEFMRRAGLADRTRVAVTLDPNLPQMLVEATALDALAVERFAIDQTTGRFEASLIAQASAAGRARPLRVTGSVVELTDVVRLRRPLARGEVVTASDVAVDRVPRRAGGETTIVASEVVGLAARRSLGDGQVLRMADLERPRVVARNEQVTITFDVPGLLVTARGRALADGAVGDVIDVQNLQSRRNVQGVVVAPGRIAVGATPPRRVAEAPAAAATR